MASDVVRESVPRFRKQIGDSIVSGANNCLIVLGRTRVGDQSGPETGAGAIQMVVGRVSEGFSPNDDRASIYLSSKIDVDAALDSTDQIDDRGVSGAVIVGDCVRVVARRSVRVSVGRASLLMLPDGTVKVEGDIRLGADAAERALLGDRLVAKLRSHVHPIPGGSTGVSIETYSDVFSRHVRLS